MGAFPVPSGDIWSTVANSQALLYTYLLLLLHFYKKNLICGR